MVAILAGLGATLIAVLLGVLTWRVSRRVERLRRQAVEAAAAARRQGREMVAQNGLEQNLDMLRMSLYGLGEPRVEGGAVRPHVEGAVRRTWRES